MPSIEIVCIGQLEVSDFNNLPFRLFAGDRLVSHRSPRPLFQPEFDTLQGCIYHLCNPDRGYTAYHLLTAGPEEEELEREWWTGIYFLPAFAPSVRMILAELLNASPVGKVVFTSDYQFGPKVRRYKRSLTLERFWELHDTRKLHMNALYPLRR